MGAVSIVKRPPSLKKIHLGDSRRNVHLRGTVLKDLVTFCLVTFADFFLTYRL